jgi:hypothetical protein
MLLCKETAWSGVSKSAVEMEEEQLQKTGVNMPQGQQECAFHNYCGKAEAA